MNQYFQIGNILSACRWYTEFLYLDIRYHKKSEISRSGLSVCVMGDNTKDSGGTAATVVTFTVENLLYTAVITSTVWFLSHYFSVVRIPAIVFMFLSVVSVLIALHTVAMLLVFSMRVKSANGAFSDSILSEVSQGFSVISSLLWLGFLWCMFLKVPRITSVPGLSSSASMVTLAIVLGFSIVIPFLATIVTYAAVPGGGNNSLIFNGSTVGALSLMFFVMVSFGSGGVMKCAPYDSAGISFTFFVMVCTFWGLLYLIELLIFFGVSPLTSMWNILTGQGNEGQGLSPEYNKNKATGFFDSFHITYWRIPGCALNMFIVFSTTGFCQSDMHFVIIITAIVIGGLHIPLILSVNLDWFLLQQPIPVTQIAELVDSKQVDTFKNVEVYPGQLKSLYAQEETRPRSYQENSNFQEFTFPPGPPGKRMYDNMDLAMDKSKMGQNMKHRF
jgi:hypothetical protein